MQSPCVRSFAFLLAVLVIGPVAAADKPMVVELWPGKVPDEPGTIGAEYVRMSPKLDRKEVEVTEPTRLVTNVTKPTLTIYRPAKEKDTGTAMLICPGGGYWNLYWELEGEEVAAWLNSIGVTGIILKYRVPRRPDEPKAEPARRPLQDAQRAVSLVRSKAKEWGIAPDRIGIVGFSAGGHLAIATATGFEKRTYEAIDEIDKVNCRPDFAVAVYSGYLKHKDKDELAPGLQVPKGTPPVLLVHGGADIVSDPEHSVVMYRALKRAGVPTELHIYAGAAHDFGVRRCDRPSDAWTNTCAVWLRHTGVLKGQADDPNLRDQASSCLRRAVEHYRKHIATEGGYLWRYSDDLVRREGEAKATATQVWVQPPGTPAVGLAYLAAHEATGDPYFLDAATETARALVRGQLRSGGWDYRIEFDPKLRKDYAYRVDGGTGGRNVTTLDDNNTQEAIRLLMRVDRALMQKDTAIHDAAVFALDALVKVQYPNGAWPQRYDAVPDPDKFPVKKANYPDAWPREFPGKDYRSYYTFNDNTLADVIDVMFEAARVYGEEKYRTAAEKAGGFILLAQMPDPQPGWAQQYDADMHPAWARKFEPASITAGESQGVMLALLRLYRETGDKKYLEPIPRALAYYRKSLLPDGRLARFYELKTNKPLYFTKDYKLTYSDDDVPTHYAFKVGNRLDAIAKEYERVKTMLPASATGAPSRAKPTASQIADVKAVLAAMDKQGRWVEDGRLRHHGADDPTRRVIDSRTFIRNVGVLSRYLAATRP